LAGYLLNTPCICETRTPPTIGSKDRMIFIVSIYSAEYLQHFRAPLPTIVSEITRGFYFLFRLFRIYFLAFYRLTEPFLRYLLSIVVHFIFSRHPPPFDRLIILISVTASVVRSTYSPIHRPITFRSVKSFHPLPLSRPAVLRTLSFDPIGATRLTTRNTRDTSGRFVTFL